MAWNPTPEVAAVRDAAKKLQTPLAVIVYLTHDGKLAMASYGQNVELCKHAGKLGEHLFDAAMRWGEAEPK